MSRLRHGDLEIVALLVPLKPVQVFSHHYLDGLDHWLELAQLALQKYPEGFAVLFGEVHGSGDIQIVLESCDMKEDRMSFLGAALVEVTSNEEN